MLPALPAPPVAASYAELCAAVAATAGPRLATGPLTAPQGGRGGEPSAHVVAAPALGRGLLARAYRQAICGTPVR